MTRSTAAHRAAELSSFGAFLRYLRRRQRLTQTDLGLATGYSIAQISRLELDQRLPNLDTLAALFVPALGLEDEPELAALLHTLARAAHADRAAPGAVRGDAAAVVAAGSDANSGGPPGQPGPSSTPLLVTKVYLPRPRVGLVPRPRLRSRLSAVLDVPLTLVSAPAGFGKTTVLADWLSAEADSRKTTDQSAHNTVLPASLRREPFDGAWLSLDEGDNDTVTFLRSLIAALQTIASTLGSATLALLDAPQSAAPETLLRLVLNDLAPCPRPMVLVLDDYHLITTSAVHNLLAVLVESGPPPLHLVIATRTDPPLPLARLRARAQIVELRAADLRFTPDEAATFLQTSMGLPLHAGDLAALETRTEGWIAGLQLAALAMRDRRDRHGFISAFTGSNRFVVDYLASEVLEQLPVHLRHFLLHTAILDRLCGSLCDAVLGVEEVGFNPRAAYTQPLLEEAERANLFLVPLDDERRWYRYHHLFGEVLRERLHSGASVAEVQTLHRRASSWFEAQGLVVETVQHALAARDWERVARVIEGHGPLLVTRGHVRTVLDWLSTIPTEVMQAHPMLFQIDALGLMATNQFAAAGARLHDAERSLTSQTPDDRGRVLRSRVAGLRGHMCLIAGDLEQAFTLIHQAADLLPETTMTTATGVLPSLTRVAAGVYGAVVAYKLSGDVTTPSERRAAEAIGPARAVHNLWTTINGYTYLAYLHVLQGRLRAAAATYAEVERLVPGQDALHTFFGSPAYYIGMGELFGERNLLMAADEQLERGMAFVQGGMAIDADVLVRGAVALARVQQARGDGATALATIRTFMDVARDRDLFHLIVERATAMEARLQLMQGALPAAQRWADASGLHPDDDLSFPREAAYLALARIRIAQGRAVDVIPLLERLLADAEAKARMHSAIEILALQALAFAARGERQRASEALERAFMLAAPEGYVRLFVDEGLPMYRLLHHVRARGTMREYIGQLLAAFPHAPNEARAIPDARSSAG